ncbi:MAG: archaemetzincin [Thermodesulfobacteriota bacterium]
MSGGRKEPLSVYFNHMSFTPPSKKEAAAAAGDTSDLPPALRRAFTPGSDFQLIPRPRPGDWLAEHLEAGQTFADFVRNRPPRPGGGRDTVFLQPLGGFPAGGGPSLTTLETFAAAALAMKVITAPPLLLEDAALTTRLNPLTGHRQVLTTDVLGRLKALLPAEAFCVLAVTFEDLYPAPSWNFVFGQASLRDRVGVFSFARYDPAFYGQARGPDYNETLLRRCAKVLLHEILHMFNIHHCLFYSCLMNGSNHLAESDRRPLHLCPVCLRKLHHGVGFNPIERYRALLVFYHRVGFKDEAEWVSKRMDWLVGE